MSARRDAIAHVEIDLPAQAPDGAAAAAGPPGVQGLDVRQRRRALNLFQHPIYDAWLIACKTAAPPA